MPEPAQQIRFCTSRDGTRIAYATCGAGPPLVWAAVWAHHLKLDWDSPVWRPWLAMLARRHTLVRYDWRGCGLSDREQVEFSFEKFVEDLEAVIEAAGLAQFALFGTAVGSAIGMAYAVRHPERVSHLVLYASYVRSKLAGNPTPQDVEEAEARLRMMEVGWPNDTPAYGQFYTSLHMPDASAEQSQSFADLLRRTTSPANACRLAPDRPPDRRAGDRAERPLSDARAPLPRGFIIRFEQGRSVAGLIPGARFVPLESRNHVLLDTEPAWQQFVEALDDFLPAVPAKPARVPASARRAHRARARGPGASRAGSRQRHDRDAAQHQRAHRPQSRVAHPWQARNQQSRPSDRPSPRGGLRPKVFRLSHVTSPLRSRTRRRRFRVWPRPATRRRALRAFRALPLAARLGLGAVAVLALWFAANALVQVVRKPTELFFPVSGVLHKTPTETWRSYAPIFRAHATSVITPELLAALAQVEATGNPVARTYWRWRATPEPFEVYRPASSAVGMYQITDGTFAEAKRYCIRDHVVAEAGAWHDRRACWLNGLYFRVVPSHAVELTAAYLDVRIAGILARQRIGAATLRQKQDLAAVIHLCGAGAGEAYAKRGFRLADGQQCGDHDVRGYLERLDAMKRAFARLASGS